MPPSLGTRLKQGFKYERLAQGAETRTHTRDLGLTPLVSASITFSSSGASATGANGTFGVVTAISGAANNGSGAIRLTVGSTTGLFTGKLVAVSNVGGTTEANGTWAITVIDGSHIDLIGSVFVHTYTSGGSAFQSSWRVNDPVLVEGANLNNGFFTITGLDPTNAGLSDARPAAEKRRAADRHHEDPVKWRCSAKPRRRCRRSSASRRPTSRTARSASGSRCWKASTRRRSSGAWPALTAPRKSLRTCTESFCNSASGGANCGLSWRRRKPRWRLAPRMRAAPQPIARRCSRRWGADRLQLAATIDAGLAALAETIKAFRQNSVDLSAAAGTPSNSGALSFDAALRCVRNVAAVAMEVEQGRPLTSQNSYLGLSNDAHGDDARLSAAETQQRALDDLAPFYLDLGQAQAAQMRRRERGDATVVAALAGGVFTLAPVARAFATREEAETALTVAGADLQVVDAVDGGAVLIGAELQAA